MIFGGRVQDGDLLCGVDAVQLRHRNVHQDNVGREFLSQLHGGAAIVGLTDNLHVRLEADHRRQAAPHQPLVLCEKNSDTHRVPILSNSPGKWSVASLSAGKVGDDLDELGWLNRLGDVRVKTCGEGQAPILRAGVRRQCDRWRLMPARGVQPSHFADQAVRRLLRASRCR